MMKTFVNKWLKVFVVCVIICVGLAGCGNGKPAPDDTKIMEEIGKTVMSSVIKNGAAGNPEKGIIVFRDAFDKHGYSLEATMEEIAKNGVNLYSQRDKIVLVMIVSVFEDLGAKKAKTVFTADEFKHAEKIFQETKNM